MPRKRYEKTVQLGQNLQKTIQEGAPFGQKEALYDTTITVFANFAWYRRTKDLVPLFNPKVQLFENSLLKILAKLQQNRKKSEENENKNRKTEGIG